jgi:hypothetical protein
MAQLPEYDINSFTWDGDERTFYGVKDELWDTTNHYQFPFPNDKKQFIIRNSETNGFRRFTFVKEQFGEGSLIEYLFESEDGIRCLVLVDTLSYVSDDIKIQN